MGAAKCGTTSLHNYLDAHPAVAMSRVKELNFFLADATWSNGVDWYRSQFDPDAAVRGESSTAYTMLPRSEGAVGRIQDTLEEPRIIYLVRDPLKRLASHYHQRRARGGEPRPLAVALRDPDNPYLPASLYATQLRPYLAAFGSERVLVESQERLLTDRAGVLRRVFAFLGVKADVELPDTDRVWESSEGKGWGYRLAWKSAERLNAHGIHLPGAVRWSAQRLIRSRLLGGGAGHANPPVIDPELRAMLEPRLREEVAELEAMTGMSFDGWMPSQS